MATQRVRAGQRFVFDPVAIDQCNPPYNVQRGDIVVVVNLHGCPKCNTMGHCHVNHPDGSFGGLVCTNSLVPIPPGTPKGTAHVDVDRPSAPAQTYKSQAAREACQQGYGKPSYWAYLDKFAEAMAAKGVTDAFTRSLSDCLRGNEGE